MWKLGHKFLSSTKPFMSESESDLVALCYMYVCIEYQTTTVEISPHAIEFLFRFRSVLGYLKILYYVFETWWSFFRRFLNHVMQRKCIQIFCNTSPTEEFIELALYRTRRAPLCCSSYSQQILFLPLLLEVYPTIPFHTGAAHFLSIVLFAEIKYYFS